MSRRRAVVGQCCGYAKWRTNGLDAALLDRLELNPERIDAMIEGLHQVADLPDPIGEVTDLQDRPSGIKLGKMRVSLGVVGHYL